MVDKTSILRRFDVLTECDAQRLQAMAEHIAKLENAIEARDSALRLANAGLEQLQAERDASKLAATQRSMAILDIAQSLVTLSAS